MTKIYCDTLEEIKNNYPDFNSSQQNEEKIVNYNGRNYVKFGKAVNNNNNVSVYLLKETFRQEKQNIENHFSLIQQNINLLNEQQLITMMKEIDLRCKEIEENKTKSFYLELKEKVLTKINEFIFQIHRSEFKNLSFSNPRLIIAFSGTFCSGKTTIAKKIEEHFKGIRINADQIRMLLVKNNLPTEGIVSQYIDFCIRKLKGISPNELLIIDRDHDDEIYKSYLKYSVPYLIRIVVPKKIILERIKTREHEIHDTEFFLNNLDSSSWPRYEKFGNNHTFDFEYHNYNNENQEPIKLFDSIKTVLESKKLSLR